MNDRPGNGWLPYVAPIFAFLLLVEISSRISDRYALAMLVLRIAIPLGLIVYFRFRGAYTELRLRLTSMTAVDVVVGIALAGLWIAPYVLLPQLRPEGDEHGFDPSLAGAAMIPLVLSLRMLGYAVVTPLMEELFMRSFLMRYADAYDTEKDFRDLPMARFSWRSFTVVVVVFLATHMMWEWWVMLPWAVLTNLWFYFRKDLFSLVVVHAATNASILLAAIFLEDVFSDGDGGTLPLWFFV
ncbi:CAAX prenyl protease-related protein [Roseimaritima ulvae]|uniref:CAAX amino terminal protease self-immunity n=1 Tax=Roseimaritima ulvae TaxID=980254 RepID=A0A5B9QKG1_9BACT|nr:CAAX prenyl protease-related protein [Roseimaritima ulvae]QEG38232.1 CAAX amino terminal protease self- immunity [Roseimaritima ulvae]